MQADDWFRQTITRRHFIGEQALGLGAAALASLCPQASQVHAGLPSAERPRAVTGGQSGVPHFAPRAKRAIYLFMSGGPSQMDMFDYKPKMTDMFNADIPQSIRMGQRLTTMTSSQARLPIAPSKFKFKQYGQSGAWVSDLLPQTGEIVDDIAIIKTVHTEAINHDPASTFICTGSQLPGRASLGAWLSYGLGSLNRDLPTFVVMTPKWSSVGNAQGVYSRMWGSGFLPGRHQGVALRTDGDPILFLSNPPGVDRALRRDMLDRLKEFNCRAFQTWGDPETNTRIEQYEMAFRMQRSAPELMDLSGESEHVLDMYGPEARQPGTFAASCLLARRMIERDVRFVQIFHRGWDQHADIGGDLPRQCHDIDQPCRGLIQDLKQRGLLEDTLVIWGGEFGRTIYCQGELTKENYGRDHHPRCFTMWMAGGGVRPGIIHGQTDDFSYNIVDKPVHIHELNATLLHALGIDHRRLTYRHQGLDERLTGVEECHPVLELLA